MLILFHYFKNLKKANEIYVRKFLTAFFSSFKHFLHKFGFNFTIRYAIGWTIISVWIRLWL